MKTKEELMVKMALDAWNTYIKRTDELISQLSDEQLMKEMSPGKNRGIYMLGHLTSVHDHMIPILGAGEVLYPSLTNAFIELPDNSESQFPPLHDLRNYWKAVNEKLSEHFKNLSADDWFQKHNSVSTEDFEKEPHRNKLNVLMNRTSHLSYHMGQMVFLK